MAFVPFTQSSTPSGRAYELGTRLKETIDGFRQEHPNITGTEIRQAVELATRGTVTASQPIALAVGVALLLLLGLFAFLFFESR
jgi:hypothetical protein